jgi:hypothetical protein
MNNYQLILLLSLFAYSYALEVNNNKTKILTLKTIPSNNCINDLSKHIYTSIVFYLRHYYCMVIYTLTTELIMTVILSVISVINNNLLFLYY